MSTTASDPTSALEAARYALLRRLAPSMRHHLVVNLQPIGMVYEVMERRLRAAQPQLSEVHEGAQKIHSYAKAALASCLDVITWLAPDDSAFFAPAEAMRELLALVQTSLTFRGYTLVDEFGEPAGQVKRAAFRMVATGALLAVSDEHAPPAQITLRGESTPQSLVVTLTVQPLAGEPGFTTAPNYRPLTWGDIDVMAAAEGAQVQRDGTTVRISLPLAPAA